jgi:hypothetical protein
MTGNEFIRKLKALGKKQGIEVSLNASRGKGSLKPCITAAHSLFCATLKMN